MNEEVFFLLLSLFANQLWNPDEFFHFFHIDQAPEFLFEIKKEVSK